LWECVIVTLEGGMWIETMKPYPASGAGIVLR